MIDNRPEENLSSVFSNVDVRDVVEENYRHLKEMSNGGSFQFHGLGQNFHEIVPKLFKPINVFHSVSPCFLCSTSKDKIT
jgi:hypothetical protein